MAHLKTRFLTGSKGLALPRSVPRRRGTSSRVVAYRESDDIKDWRIKQMVTLCHTYFQKLWCKGNTSISRAEQRVGR